MTARSASRSCGGIRDASAPVSTLRILPRRSITYQDAAKRPPLQDGSLDVVVEIVRGPKVEGKAYRRWAVRVPPLQFGDHYYLDACLGFAVDLDGDLVCTEGLYGLFEADAASVQADAAGSLDGVGDVGGGYGTEQSLVLACTGLDGDHALVEDAGDLLGPLGEAPVSLLALLHGAAGFLQLGRRSHLGETPGNEEVAHVAAAHVHYVAALADLLHVALEYDLQALTSPPRRAATPSPWRALSPMRPRAGAADTDPLPCGPSPFRGPRRTAAAGCSPCSPRRHVLLAENARLALGRTAPAGRSVPSPTHSLPP